MTYEVIIGDQTHRVELVRSGTAWHCRLDGHELSLDAVFVRDGVLSILIDGQSYEVKQESTGAENNIVVGRSGARFRATVRDPRSLRSRRRGDDSAQGIKKIAAPMPGKVVRILATAGTEVEAGQAVLVIEAMKMQNELKSPKRGRVKRINVAEKAAVEAGQVLAEIE
jgi:biotin carboxyl carrier protein